MRIVKETGTIVKETGTNWHERILIGKLYMDQSVKQNWTKRSKKCEDWKRN